MLQFILRSLKIFNVFQMSLKVFRFSNLACNNISKYLWKCSLNSAKLYDFQKFSKVSIILSSLKYNILTSHIYMLKLCQDRLYSVVFPNNSWLNTSPIVVSNQQMLSLFLRQKNCFHLKMLKSLRSIQIFILEPKIYPQSSKNCSVL